MPHPNREIRGWEKRLYRRFPALQKLVRGGIYAGRELFVLGFVKDPRLMKVAEKIARKHMATQISDPELLEKVTPDYTIGCKRILPSNRWYRALSQAQRRAAHRRRREGHAQLDRHRRRRGARGRRDHLRHRLPGHRHAGRPDGARAGRQDARRRLAGQPEGPPRHGDAGLPEPVRAARAEHRPRALVDGLHDRVAGRLRARRAALHGPPRRRHRAGARRTRPSATTPTSTSACRARCGTPAARAGTSTTPGATRRCGPTGRCASAARTAEFDPADFELERRAAPTPEPVTA